jgi:hypothetical protein
MWMSEVPGKYKVIANFAGTESYYPSYSKRVFGVADAATTPALTEISLQSATDMYFVPAIAGLFVLVIIIGFVLALLMLRKRSKKATSKISFPFLVIKQTKEKLGMRRLLKTKNS